MYNKFYYKAKQICLENEIDTVIAVNQPIDSVYAGMLLKKDISTLKFIPYLLDPIRVTQRHRFISEKNVY